MTTTILRLYMHESHRLHGRLLYEWLLEEAKNLGIQGGSVFRAVAGYGRHGVLHDQRFFELAGELPVVTELIGSDAEIQQLLDRLRRDSIDLPYARWSAQLAMTCGTPQS